VTAIGEEIIATPAASVVGILVKLRVAAEDSDPGDFLDSALADAERIAPEHWPDDYPPIPAA
jgi:hypothetical protein